MTVPARDPAEAFLTIAFAIDRHRPGYVDSCYADVALRSRLDPKDTHSAKEIEQACRHLLVQLETHPDLEPARKGYMADQTRAMQACAARLEGATGSLLEDARLFFDISPGWIDEHTFMSDQAVLRELLPRSGSELGARLAAHRQAARLPMGLVQQLIPKMAAELRRRTIEAFGLPSGESVSIALHDDRPSAGYHRYFGGFRSQIDVNGHQLLDVPGLVHLLAHEAYPGHHAELALKEANLTRGRGWSEHLVTILDAPACVISEGIAVRGLSIVFGEPELAAWCAELMASAGQDPCEAERTIAIESARQRLRSVVGNAAILLEAAHGDDREAGAYLQRFGLTDAIETDRIVRFIRSAGAYVFTYHWGGLLIDGLIEAARDQERAFAALLNEPFSPSQVRAWVARERASDLQREAALAIDR